MKGSRITAIGLVAAAVLWIASGHFIPHESAESKAAVRPTETEPARLFRVAVQTAELVPHSQKLVLSGRTEADRKVMATARTSGVISELKVRRGDRVKQGDLIAVLSDEAREAQVAQARAVVTQRRNEWEAKSRLIALGNFPRLEAGNVEAQLKIAEAQLAAAEAERDRGIVTAPWSGIVNDVPVELGQAAFSMAGKEIAQIIALDPMLAVVEVAERKLGGIKINDRAEVRLVTGQVVAGHVRFVSKMASPVTRTYRVEVEMANAKGEIPDGITAEVAIPMAPAPAARVPRSALTFSSAGDLGVRHVDDAGKVGFVPVSVIEDEQSFIWVGGIADRAKVIVQGQDFVREGQKVESVEAEAPKDPPKTAAR
jgi:multidrug efflux system membrane fusion protein